MLRRIVEAGSIPDKVFSSASAEFINDKNLPVGEAAARHLSGHRVARKASKF